MTPRQPAQKRSVSTSSSPACPSATKHRKSSAPNGKPADAGETEFQVNDYSLSDVVHRLWPMLRPYRGGLLLAAVLVLICSACIASGPIFARFVVDQAIPQGKLGWVAAAMGLFLGVMLIRVVCWFFSFMKLLWISEKFIFRFRQRGFQHLQRLCLRFHSQNPTGSLFNRIFERSICDLGVFLRNGFPQMIVSISGIVLSLIACLWLSVPMTGVVLASTMGFVYITRRLSPAIRQRSRIALDCHHSVSGYIMDRLRGIKTIQAYSMEDRVDDEFESNVWPIAERYIEAQKVRTVLSLAIESLGYVVTAVVWFTGAAVNLHWGMSVGTLIAFVGYQAELTRMMGMIANQWGALSSARAGFDQLHTVLDTRSTVTDKPGATMPDSVTGRLAVRNVSFAYDSNNGNGDGHVLSEVTLDVPPGQTVALVGRSGSGKSTLANLLLRFYDPQDGAILLDDADIRDLPLRDYRSLFGVVLQDPFLFNESIAENLRCASPDATEQDMIEALQAAQAWDFVQGFPEGLYQSVGEMGSRLSGGQRQRIAIARSMLLNPRFLILDEATSALDVESERAVQKSFDALFRNRTSFVIAHRLSTIRKADRIVVLDEGRVAEDGSYEDLIRAKGLFYQLHTIATSTSTRNIKLDEAGFA